MGIPREGAGYHDESASGVYASASHIRRLVREGGIAAAAPYMPAEACAILKECADAGRGPVYPEHFDTAVLTCLRRATPHEIAQWPDVTEGLENRLHRLAQETTCVEELVEAAATRRYTSARIRRILFYGLVGLTKRELDGFKRAGGPAYLRVLGFKDSGIPLLKAIRQNAKLPLVMSPAKAIRELASKTARAQLLLDIRAQNLYDLGMPDARNRKGNADYYRPYIHP